MADKKIPMRTCIVCKREFDKKSLIRIVKDKNGAVFIDESGKANGRGAYFCGCPTCRAKLVKSKALDRAFGITVAAEVYSELGEIKID